MNLRENLELEVSANLLDEYLKMHLRSMRNSKIETVLHQPVVYHRTRYQSFKKSVWDYKVLKYLINGHIRWN